MRAALGPVLALALLACLLPASSAQAPEPDQLVPLACATVAGVDPAARDLLPVCPQGEPQPDLPDEEAQVQPEPAAPGPAEVDDAQRFVDEALDDLQQIPDDPAGAPDRLLGLVGRVVAFVRDLLGLPGAGLERIGASADEARAELAAFADATAQRAQEDIRHASQRVAALFQRLVPGGVAAPGRREPHDVSVGPDEVGGLLELPRRDLRQVLAERQ